MNIKTYTLLLLAVALPLTFAGSLTAATPKRPINTERSSAASANAGCIDNQETEAVVAQNATSPGVVPATQTIKHTTNGLIYSGNHIDILDVVWYKGKIEIVERENDLLSIYEKNNAFKDQEKMRYWIDGRVLHIRYCQDNSNTVKDGVEKHLVVEVPKGMDLTFHNMPVREDYRDVKPNPNVIGIFYVDNVNTEINGSNSNIKLTIPRYQGAHLFFNTMSGDLNTDLPWTMKDDHIMFGRGINRIKVNTTSGNLNIR